MARISAPAKVTARRRLLETAASHVAGDGLNRAKVDAISLDAGFQIQSVEHSLLGGLDVVVAAKREAE